MLREFQETIKTIEQLKKRKTQQLRFFNYFQFFNYSQGGGPLLKNRFFHGKTQ
jgi:hypothetical protein